MKTKFFWMVTITLLAALLLSGTAFAEGEEPPAIPEDPTSLVVETQPIEPAAELPEIEEALTTGEPIVDIAEEPILAAPAAEPAAAFTPVDEETALSADPQVVVIDAQGESTDMACQESAAAIAAADPYFTSGGITYRFSEAGGYCAAYYPGDPNCYDSQTNAIQSAVDYVHVNGTIPVDGKIYVEKDTYSNPVTIDGSLEYLENLKGLIGIAGAGIFPTISNDVLIRNLLTGFTLSGFTIDGAVEIDNVTGVLNLTDLTVHNTGGTGISVTSQKGHINLTNVKSSHNKGTGARLDNSFSGNVTIKNSAFDENDAYALSGLYVYGLGITTNGIISIDGLSASRNNGDGLNAVDFSNLKVMNSVLNENKTSPANSGYGYGLYALTNKPAPTTLDAVYANDNSYTGLYIYTGAGAISLNHIEANDSDSRIGAQLENTTAVISVSNCTFKNNTDGGLMIYSLRAVTLTSIHADENSGVGVYVDNCRLYLGVCTGSGSVTVTSPSSGSSLDANSFNENSGGDGLHFESNGSVTLTNLDSNVNNNYGVYIDNRSGSGSVTINKNLSGWYNEFTKNGESGVIIFTNGIVTISDSSADGNGKNGVCTSLDSTKNVAISRGSFSSNGYSGLLVYSKGSVNLTDITASQNDSNLLDANYYCGADINNTFGTGSVTIKSSAAGNYYEFSSNSLYGIQIQSKGMISVGNVNVFENGNQGFFASNWNTTGSPAINVTRSEFNRNGMVGLLLYSKGSVTLTDVSASGNDHFNRADGNYYSGASIINTYGTGGVTIKSSSKSVNYTFGDNTDNGITIASNGAVSVGNITASGNHHRGLYIDNTTSSASPAVSITLGTFENNRFDGVRVQSKGIITLTDTQANSNGSAGVFNGADLSNISGTSSGVTVKSSSTANYFTYYLNTYDGIMIFSRGVVSVGNVIAEGNPNNGVDIDNTYAATAKSVSVTRSKFSGSGREGLSILSIGAVTLDSIQANENGHTDSGYSGVNVNACVYSGGCRGIGSITLRGSGNEFFKNGSCGLELNAFGSIMLSNFKAEGNSGSGVYLFNMYAGSSSGITISAGGGAWNSANTNESTGLNTYSYGTILISRLIAENNMNGGGAYLNNEGGISRSVTLNDCTFNSNEGNGVEVRTSGIVIFNGVAANWNSIHDGTINDEDAGEVIYERLTSDTGEDLWHFAGDAGDSYTIELLETEFDGLLQLYDGSDALVASDDSDPLGSYGALVKIVIPNLLTTDDYYVRVSGGTGDYTLYFDSWVRQQWSDFYGAYIQNTSGSGGVTINSSANTNSVFNENNKDGIAIYTPGNSGTISIINTSASGNGYNGAGEGIHIETGTGNVSITTSGTTLNSSFNWNNDNGIYIFNEGSITLSGRIFVNSNLESGARLLNYLAATAKPVTVSGVIANGNQSGHGLDIQTIGNISLTSITAMGNSSSGVSANNWISGSGVGNLTITGNNTFSDNTVNGLQAYTNGTVSITGVTAEGNSEHGITLSSYGVGKTVSLKNISTLYNNKNGLNLYVSGATTLDTIRSYFNGIGSNADGLHLIAGTVAVTIKNSSLIGNEGNGIDLLFSGSYTLLNTSYFGNDTNHSLEPDLYVH